MLIRKWIAGIISILLIVAVLIYLLIPSPIVISNWLGLKATPDAVNRTVVQQDRWDELSGGTFLITKRLLNTVLLEAKQGKLSIPLKIFLIPAANDSVTLTWESSLPVVKGPVAKLNQYIAAKTIKKQVDSIVGAFRSLVQKPENIYGIAIKEQISTKDTLLIVTKFNAASYPSLKEIYGHVAELETFAESQEAETTGYPMLNVAKKENGIFQCTVALPVNKILGAAGQIYFARMVPGRFLTAEFRGGPATIQRSHDMIQLYFSDYKRNAVALPFEYMVTNRLTEPDTTKWITAIYAPVF